MKSSTSSITALYISRHSRSWPFRNGFNSEARLCNEAQKYTYTNCYAIPTTLKGASHNERFTTKNLHIGQKGPTLPAHLCLRDTIHNQIPLHTSRGR